MLNIGYEKYLNSIYHGIIIGNYCTCTRMLQKLNFVQIMMSFSVRMIGDTIALIKLQYEFILSFFARCDQTPIIKYKKWNDVWMPWKVTSNDYLLIQVYWWLIVLFMQLWTFKCSSSGICSAEYAKKILMAFIYMNVDLFEAITKIIIISYCDVEWNSIVLKQSRVIYSIICHN